MAGAICRFKVGKYDILGNRSIFFYSTNIRSLLINHKCLEKQVHGKSI